MYLTQFFSFYEYYFPAVTSFMKTLKTKHWNSLENTWEVHVLGISYIVKGKANEVSFNSLHSIFSTNSHSLI